MKRIVWSALVALVSSSVCSCMPGPREPLIHVESEAEKAYKNEVRAALRQSLQYYKGRCMADATEVIYRTIEHVDSVMVVTKGKVPGDIGRLQVSLGLTRVEKEGSKKNSSRYIIRFRDIVDRRHHEAGTHGREITVLDGATGEVLALRREFSWRDPDPGADCDTLVCPATYSSPEEFLTKVINHESYPCWRLSIESHQLESHAEKPSYSDDDYRRCATAYWNAHGYSWIPVEKIWSD